MIISSNTEISPMFLRDELVQADATELTLQLVRTRIAHPTTHARVRLASDLLQTCFRLASEWKS